MVYKAEVTTNTTFKEYYETSEKEFKSRYNNHIHDLSDTYSILMVRNYPNTFGC